MRRLLSPSWLLLHVACFAIAYLFIRLGIWQWEKARSPHGMPYNYIYALQWWGFTIFGMVLWGRTVLDEVRPKHEPTAEERAEEAAGLVMTEEELAELAVDDAELADYNRYLASLNDPGGGAGPRPPWRTTRARPAG